MTRSMIWWLAVLFMFSGGAVGWLAWRLGAARQDAVHVVSVPDSSSATTEEILTEFTLTERSGRQLSSRDLLGTVWVASFFFSSCPGSCRAQNLELLALHNAFAKKGVKFVSITCDPVVDTPAKLSEYAATLGASKDTWYFLTGELKYIRRVGTEIFRVWVDERGHMDRFMVVDRWGRIRGYFDWHDRARLEQMKNLLEELLAETEPPPHFTPVMAVPGALPHQEQQLADEEPIQDEHAAGTSQRGQGAQDAEQSMPPDQESPASNP